MSILKKNIYILVLIISLTTSACGPGQLFGPTLTPTPTTTLTTTVTITFTPTLTLTPTVNPTETATLSPREQLESDYGILVPKNEKCVLAENVSLGYDYTQDNTRYAVLQVRATKPENAKWMTISLGAPQDKKEREVLTLPVVCRDVNGHILKTLLILGGRYFGKNGADLNVYYNHKGGKDFQVVPAQEIAENIQEGDRLEIYVVTKPGQGNFKKLGSNWEGATNELTVLSILMVRDNQQYSDVINLLAQGSSEVPIDSIIIPDRIDLYSRNN